MRPDGETTSLDRCLDAIYDAPVRPGGWTGALSELAALFHAGFADVCSWTPDRAHVSGVAVGLDAGDYDNQLLGFWFNRNVWGKTSPVRVAGEVISTRQMMPREDLRRSEMYHEYLRRRGLHEGLRLSLWVDDDSLADISLLRPWSLGAFGPAEVALGRTLLPHLQRAASLTRHLRQTEIEIECGTACKTTNPVAAIVFDRVGIPIHFNRSADAILARGEHLQLTRQGLRAASAEATNRLSLAVARAAGRSGPVRTAGIVRLPWDHGSAAATVVVQPVSLHKDWALPRPPAAIALFRDPSEPRFGGPLLQTMFGLTAAEARLASDLLAGRTLQEVAEKTRRSRNTLHTHLTRLMDKTGTTRQVDLIRVLTEVEALGIADGERGRLF